MPKRVSKRYFLNDPPYNLDMINNVENFDVFQSQPFLILTIPKCFPVGEMRKLLLWGNHN